MLGINVVIGLADDRFSAWSLALLGTLMGFATLINQMHVLLIPCTAAAVLLIWYRRRPEVTANRLLAGLASFGGAAALIIGVAYFGVTIFILGKRDLGRSSYGRRDTPPNLSDHPLSITDPIKGAIGIAAMLGGHFLAGFDWFYGPFTRAFPGKLMIEERYLALGLSPAHPHRLPDRDRGGHVVGAGRAVFTLAGPPRRGGASRANRAATHFRTRCVLLPFTLIASYIFNVVWEPTNDEFWIGLLPIGYLAIASLFARRPLANRHRVAGFVFVASLFIANGLGVIWPQTKLALDYWYQANRFLIENARAADTVVTDGAFISDNYVSYYTGANVVGVHSVAPDDFARLLSDKHAGRVWVSSWAFEPMPEVRATGMLKGRDEKAIQSVREQVKMRLIKRDENPWQTVWQLEDPGDNL